jgi:DNA ligase D-like protein (predicted 3'-phosphoesterase)
MPRFVVHEHRAKKAGLHYDLRLEIDGVLKSWAFRKEPPIQPGIKRLGIRQPDHELSYIDFQGLIREGYGAGVVSIWDNGEMEIIEYSPDKKIKVILKGGKLSGEYVLINTSRGWLLFKKK